MYYIYQSPDKDGNMRSRVCSCKLQTFFCPHFFIMLIVTQWESYSHNHMLIIKMIDAGKV